MTAADEVASSIALYDDYAGMFRMANLNTVPEVLLFRAYSLEEKVSHYVQSYLQSNGGGNTGFFPLFGGKFFNDERFTDLCRCCL